MIDPNFIISYSTLKEIILQDEQETFSYNIFSLNPECQFERLETIENINEVFPNGSLIVRDTKDIISFISANKITKILFTFLDGMHRTGYITATSYLNNAASDNEENFVSIYFSNKLYRTMQNTALLDLLPYENPQVFLISDFVNTVASSLNTSVRQISPISNYIVYKPFTTTPYRSEHPTDNPLQYLNYVTAFACSPNTLKPRFMFWTNWAGELVLKYFEEKIDDDTYANDDYIEERGLRYKIYDPNNENVSLRSQKKVYKKIYYMGTDPAQQFISKNYYYIRKTPKLLDLPPGGVPPTSAYSPYNMETLLYQYQDEGQKYNIEMVASNRTNNMVPGADEIFYDKEWGYYNTTLMPTDDGRSALIGQDFGSANQYSRLLINGVSGYFQYVDNTDMWKMMFDFTEVHPNYPDTTSFIDYTVSGNSTYLQKVLDIKYQAYEQNRLDAKARLETFRKIEKENFVMYALCCMSKEENCFFAKLTKYELDKTYGAGLSGSPGLGVIGGISGSTFIPYRYKWVKLNFNSTYGDTGPVNYSGTGGTAYFCHNVEAWEEDPLVKSSSTQDNTWAINLNERSIGTKYLPPGWVPSALPQGFYWRPVGANSFPSDGNIRHIVKMCAVPVSDLMLDSRQNVPSNYLGQYLYYFTAENVVDGSCTVDGLL